MGIRLGHGLTHHELEAAIAVQITESQSWRSTRAPEAEGSHELWAAGRLLRRGMGGGQPGRQDSCTE
jgi:hypothetical protein